MKYKKLLITVAFFSLWLCPLKAFAQKTVTASLPKFNITVNHRYVENSYRQYPFIVYDDITYFPMTYADCAFLGLKNVWSAEDGNAITVVEPFGKYDDSITPKKTFDDFVIAPIITEEKISVNGVETDNSSEKYPILSYNDVLYFPLTSKWCDAFGWTAVFTDAFGLCVSSNSDNDFVDTVYYYSANSDEVFSCKAENLNDLNLSNSEQYGYSPNHFFANPNSEDFTVLYSLEELNFIFVKSSEISKYISLGWHLKSDFSDMCESYLKHASVEALEENVSVWLKNVPNFSESDKNELLKQIDYYKENYVNLWTLNLEKQCAVAEEYLESFGSVGWYTYDDFVIRLAKQLAADNYYNPVKAVTALNLGMNNLLDDIGYDNKNLIYSSPQGVLFYVPMGNYHKESYDSEYRTLIRSFSDRCLANSESPLAISDYRILSNTDSDKPQAVISFANISYKEIKSAELSVTCIDKNGNAATDYSIYGGTIALTLNGSLAATESGFCKILLYANSKTDSVKNVYVKSVVYSDGTKWEKYD